MPDGEGEKLWTTTTSATSLGNIAFTVGSRENQPALSVRKQVWAREVNIVDSKKGRITVTCMVAREVGASVGVKPIEWRLLTNRPLATHEQVLELIDWHRARWEIEIYFHVIKNDCAVEDLQLSSIDRLERALALFMVVAWRVT